MPYIKTPTLKEAKLKAESFCAYQERTQQEVRNKLYRLGLYGDEIEEIIAQLISEGFINEERFAKAYAGGKFRVNHWGRHKIRLGLQSKGISAHCLESGMKEIEEEDYLQKIDYLINKKYMDVEKLDSFKMKQKLGNYLVGRGFESEIVWDRITKYFS